MALQQGEGWLRGAATGLQTLGGVGLCAALAVAGDAVATRLTLPVPGAVLGLLVYLGWLVAGRGVVWSRPGAALLLRWLGALIVPALVGLVAYADVLAAAVLPLAIVIAVTTLATAVTTALLYRVVRA